MTGKRKAFPAQPLNEAQAVRARQNYIADQCVVRLPSQSLHGFVGAGHRFHFDAHASEASGQALANHTVVVD